MGLAAQEAVRQARRTLARTLACEPAELVFTASGSEANNLALFGTAGRTRKRKLVVSAIEHPAVLEPARELRTRGFDVQVVPVDRHGLVDPDQLLARVDEETFLVSCMAANNEIGTILPVKDLARQVKRKVPDILFHTDAVQYFPARPVHLADGLIDLLTLAGHKLHGPKGTGLLYVRDRVSLRPLVFGGGQEGGRRAGTENVPGIVGLAEAVKLADKRREHHCRKVGEVADGVAHLLRQGIPDISFNGAPAARLPGLLSVNVPGVKSQNLLHFLEAEGVMVSAGAACRSESTRTSHVLQAIGRDDAAATIRISASYFNTQEEGEEAARRFIKVVARLR